MLYRKVRQPDYKGILTDYEFQLLLKARGIKPSVPPHPWGNMIVISAAGVVAGGWTKEENYVVISSNGYSINNATSGERIERNYNSELTYKNISKDYLHFTIPSNDETIDIHGIDAGDGIHITEEGWVVELIYPWWPRVSIMMKNVHVKNIAAKEYLDDVYILDIPRLDGWMKAGFSPSGKHLAILGSGGVVMFSVEWKDTIILPNV